jgi:hypothetical protein
MVLRTVFRTSIKGLSHASIMPHYPVTIPIQEFLLLKRTTQKKNLSKNISLGKNFTQVEISPIIWHFQDISKI